MCKHRIALQKAIDIVGGQSELARKLRIKQPQVNAWLRRDKTMSAKYVLPIEELTKGEVTRYELRPDVFGEAPDSEE